MLLRQLNILFRMNPALALVAASLSVFLGACAVAQTNTSPESVAEAANSQSNLPAFEVATIKPAPGGIAGFSTSSGGRMKCAFCNLDMLMYFAFDAQSYQIVGEPDWGHHEGYSIVAMPPDSSELSKLSLSSPTYALTDEQRQMLQALLIDRFQLKYHREHKIGPVYVLIKGKGTVRLNPPKDASASPRVWFPKEGLIGQNATMTLLATQLSANLQCPVLDKTGEKGSFDFKYEAGTQSSISDYSDFVASILTSVQEIGLKLKSAKGPVETIVIDHVERPSPN